MISEKERREIYEDAILEYGEESQVDMVIEECSELIGAIQKRRRGRNTKEDVLKEVADVYNTIEQLTLILTDGEQIRPHSACDEKLERLKGRLYEK